MSTPDAPRMSRPPDDNGTAAGHDAEPTPEQRALWSLFDSFTSTQMQGLVEGEHHDDEDGGEPGWRPKPLNEIGLFHFLRNLDERRLLDLVNALNRKGINRVLRLATLVPLSPAVVDRARERLKPPAVVPAVALTRAARVELYMQRRRLRQPLCHYADILDVQRIGVQLHGKKSPHGDQGQLRLGGQDETDEDTACCPKCNALVPRPKDDSVRFTCPVCHRRVMIVDEYSGERLADARARGKKGKPHA